MRNDVVGRRRKGRSKQRCMDTVTMDLTEMCVYRGGGGGVWRQLVTNIDST